MFPVPVRIRIWAGMGVLLVNGGMRYAVVGVFLVFGGLFVANAGAAPLYLEAGSAFPRRDNNRTAPQLSLDPLEFAANLFQSKVVRTNLVKYLNHSSIQASNVLRI